MHSVNAPTKLMPSPTTSRAGSSTAPIDRGFAREIKKRLEY